jgi:uncharacterized membrane protein
LEAREAAILTAAAASATVIGAPRIETIAALGCVLAASVTVIAAANRVSLVVIVILHQIAASFCGVRWRSNALGKSQALYTCGHNAVTSRRIGAWMLAIPHR